jgi:hypothetical protein
MATARPGPNVRALHRPLVVLALVTGAAAVIMLPAMLLDNRQLFGVSVWLKPWKFAVSIAIYSLTIAWLLTLVHRGARVANAAGTAIVIMLGAEIVLIVLQAARGVPSHFNNESAFDSAVFSIMGVGIVLAWAATLVLALVLLREERLRPIPATGVHWGLGVSLFGAILALLMVDPMNEPVQRVADLTAGTPLDGAHTIGAAEGGPGMPVTNWSLDAGDLRAPHFVGLHALQFLPLFAWLLEARARTLTAGQGVAIVRIAGAAYFGLVVVLLWQAVRGESVARPGLATLLTGGLLVAAAAVAAVGVLRSGSGPAPHSSRGS